MQSEQLNQDDLEAVQALFRLQSRTRGIFHQSFQQIEEQKNSNVSRKSRSRNKDQNLKKERTKSESDTSRRHPNSKKLKKPKKELIQEDSEDEIEVMIRSRKHRSYSKPSRTKKHTLKCENDQSIDFSKGLKILTQQLHGDKKKLHQDSTQLLNDCLNDMTKKILANSKDLMTKLARQHSTSRMTMSSWDIKSSLDLLFGYGSSKAKEIDSFATSITKKALRSRAKSLTTFKTKPKSNLAKNDDESD